ncbi:MAG TPA: amidohydrolase family protein [Gemmatimonadales bacterium]|nr:amidohydrolase family protein [Gemmatimonadales bacterium]
MRRADRRAGGRAGRRAVGLLLLGVLTPHASLLTQTIAITGGTVYPVSGPRIERGTVLIQNGRITAVGANVTVPADAQRVDATGKWVTPGLIFAGSDAGTGVGGIFGMGEARHEGDVNPSFSPTEGLDPLALTIGQTRTGGVTTAIVPPGGTLIPGQAVTIDLAGERTDSLLVQRGTALVINLGDGSKRAGGGSRAGVMARLRKLFNDALEYDRRRADFRRAQMQELSAPASELEALLPALRGRQPVVIQANRQMDIENALRLTREFRLRTVLAGGIESWLVARELAAARVPVAVRPLQDIPSFDGLQARLDLATLLREAGVDVIIAQADAGGDRDLRYVAGNAVRNGMTWDDALRSVTQAPAAAFGLTDRGTLEAGKVANVVVWSNDPLDFAGHAEKVFIRGREVSLRTRETELLERYRRLPVNY